MGKNNIVVGLEIGTSKICVVVSEITQDGSIKILGVGQAPSRGVRRGEIVDLETARLCVLDALTDAEEKSDIPIESVYVSVTGTHISSFNNRGTVQISEEQEEIEVKDYEMVRANACEVSIPSENAFIHSISQQYYVDGQDGVMNPIGMMGNRLEADFHIIFGIGTRLKNTIRCVRDVPLDVEDIVFAPLASAQVVLTPEQKALGVLMVDMGGGTTDYIVYVDGAVRQTGVLGVGGDHVMNDISLGLRIPTAKAERLKIEEGNATLGMALPGEMIALKDERGFAGKEVERETLNTIIHLRLRETFEILKRRLEKENFLDYLGSGMVLTGGCSQIQGVAILAEEVFGMPVQVSSAQPMSGLTSVFQNPQFSTALGLIKYAQATMVDRPRGLFGRLRKILPFRFSKR